MENKFEKFLEFNGKTLLFLTKDGKYWIAIKPVCEALNVDYIRQFKNIKEDKILGAALSNQTMQAEDDQPRNWASLPEKFFYGWLFSIKSDSSELEEYKWKCYEILYDYFKGSITKRMEVLKEKTLANIEIKKLEEALLESKEYKDLQEYQKIHKEANSKLLKLDKEIITQQLTLWEQEI